MNEATNAPNWLDADSREEWDDLLRVLELEAGEFALFLVRCELRDLRDRLVAALENAPVAVESLNLDPEVTTLFTTIYETVSQTMGDSPGRTLGEKTPEALSVVGFESLQHLETVLNATNQSRDEFRKNFHFPLLLWIDDRVFSRFARSIPDFRSWAGSFQFRFSDEALTAFLEEGLEALLEEAAKCDRFVDSQTLLGEASHRELLSALQDFQKRGLQADAALAAKWAFYRGREKQQENSWDKALELYGQSLEFWQACSSFVGDRLTPKGAATQTKPKGWHECKGEIIPANLKAAIAQFQIGTCYQNQEKWENALSQFQAALETFEAEGRSDLATPCSEALGNVLVSLEAWNQLEALARRWCERQETDEQKLSARHWGFLARVALARQNWQAVCEYGERAIAGENLARCRLTPKGAATQTKPKGANSRVRTAHQNLDTGDLRYFLWVAEAREKLNEPEKAIAGLEKGRSQCDPAENPEDYVKLLQQLHRLYYDSGQYLSAFEVKQHSQQVRFEFGLLAFIGAGQLQPSRRLGSESGEAKANFVASGRERDIEVLIGQRIAQPRHNLTVLYGHSGVGKSSLVQAGLIPALRDRSFSEVEARIAFPVTIRSYKNWLQDLCEAMEPPNPPFQGGLTGTEPDPAIAPLSSRESIPPLPRGARGDLDPIPPLPREVGGDNSAPVPPLVRGVRGDLSPDFQPERPPLDELKARLIYNVGRHRLTVLIFDQFEEFFFTCSEEQRREFYQFLADCLQGTTIPFVSILLSLREDYLHRLLELEAFLNRAKEPGEELEDILGQKQRHRLGNFSPEVARNVIADLTERSALELDKNLLEALVDDLARPLGEVRPIELQVVGAQLEAETIETLEAYRSLGDNPKETLAEGWIAAIVRDCGPKYEEAVWQVLMALTDEKGIRPLRTKQELAAELTYQPTPSPSEPTPSPSQEGNRNWSQNRNWPPLLGGVRGGDPPTELLEKAILPVLVGSGLVVQEPQERYKLVHDYLVEPIRRKYNADYQQKFAEMVAAWKKAEADSQRSRQRLLAGAIAATFLFAGFSGLSGWLAVRANREAERATQARKIAEARQLAAKSGWLRQQIQHQQASVLLAVESARQLKELGESPLDADIALRESLGLRLAEPVASISHDGWVIAASFSPDGQYLATASYDNTARISRTDSGAEIARISHDGRVVAASFSPNGQYLATASYDNTARISRTDSGAEIARISHDGPVIAASFSPDGQYLATASYDNTARISRTDSGAEIARISHDEKLRAASFSPDGQYLATASYDNTARVSRTDTGAEIARISHDDTVWDASFSPDGQYLATASKDETARISRTDSGAEIARISHDNWVNATSFSPDGKYLATASRDGTARISRTDTGAEIARISHDEIVWDASFSPDGQYLATASKDETARISRTDSGAEIARISHDYDVIAASFSPDGKYLATASWKGTARISRIDSKAEIARISHDDDVIAASFSPDGQYLATASRDGTARISRTDTGAEIARISHDDDVIAASFSPNGQYLATASRDGTARISRTDTGAEVARITHDDDVIAASFSPNGQYLATASLDKTARISRTDTGAEVARITHDDDVIAASFSSDGQYLATASKDGTARISRTDTGAEIARITHDDWVNATSFSSDGQYLATASKDGTARISRTDSGAEIARINYYSSVIATSFSPDGQYLATASRDGTARISRTDTGAEIARISHDNSVIAASFSPDGKYLATASTDGTARISRTDTGAEIARISHDNSVIATSFSPDGQYLVTASTDGTARIHHRQIEPLMAENCRRSFRNLSPFEWQSYVNEPLSNYRLTCEALPVYESVLGEAIQLARTGNQKDRQLALNILRRVKELQPDIDLNPETKEVETDPQYVVNQINGSG
ncbi:MAG: hypothetical protein F6J93_00865 [Oscillatoria sp. SIO1A7]|nr:hypothetical protein [Oscillatoria sp. SIO1A7]